MAFSFGIQKFYQDMLGIVPLQCSQGFGETPKLLTEIPLSL
jgi:hypothetical protein